MKNEIVVLMETNLFDIVNIKSASPYFNFLVGLLVIAIKNVRTEAEVKKARYVVKLQK